MAALDNDGLTQPLVFKDRSGMYWIKADHSAIPVPNVSCFSDCMDTLFQFMFVFNVTYPHELHLTYGFFEKLVGVKPTVGRSVQIDKLLQVIGHD